MKQSLTPMDIFYDHLSEIESTEYVDLEYRNYLIGRGYFEAVISAVDYALSVIKERHQAFAEHYEMLGRGKAEGNHCLHMLMAELYHCEGIMKDTKIDFKSLSSRLLADISVSPYVGEAPVDLADQDEKFHFVDFIPSYRATLDMEKLLGSNKDPGNNDLPK